MSRIGQMPILLSLLHYLLFFSLFTFGIANTGNAAEKLSGENVLIIYKQGDGLSQKIADYYAEQRDVPAEQKVSVTIPAQTYTLTPEQFSSLKNQIKPYLNDKIKVLLMTWHSPYRVSCMSITSAMSLGFDESYCSHNKQQPSGCHPTANSPFYNTTSEQLWQNTDNRLSMMLSGRDFIDAKRLIERSVRADQSAPSGNAFLVRTQDHQRSTRWRMFKKLAHIWPEKNGIQIHYIDDRKLAKGTSIRNKRDVMFYMTGYVQVPDIKTNRYLPGAIADHLTSVGGAGINIQGQMKAYRWLEAGVTGSYGTVVEPCNYPQKFPNPYILIPSYMDGDTLIEAYWKSVQQPGEGIFIGEPLACPWCQ